jgi:hypothetical protein
MDMFYQKSRNALLLLIFVIIIGCVNNTKKKRDLICFNIEEIEKIRNNSFQVSQQNLKEADYWKVYSNMNDSIENWINNKLGNYKYWRSLINYRIDSIICFNNDNNKLITAILLPYVNENGVQDQIKYYYGVKITNHWYFFGGPTLVLPREFYRWRYGQ